MKSIEHLLKGITGNVYKYTLALKDLKNKTVIDIPCGDGRMSAVFKELGATVESYDLDSRNNDYIDHEHKFADMNERLPIDSNHADIILCQEGIEHLQDQFLIFSEFNRILKKGGILILTTPSISNLRSKLAYLFMETENFKRLPYNEIDALWRVDRTSNKPKIYFGHLFLITCSKLFTISKINGFRLREQILTKISPSSFFWFILFYPLILLSNALSYLIYLNDNKLRTDVKDNIMHETFLMNINYKTLISKHTFWILEKNMSISETINSLSPFVEEVSKETKSNREVR
jgi:SAM-dependent methyltransferase